MVEGARLESVCTGNRTEGSNLSPPLKNLPHEAAFFIKWLKLFLCRIVELGPAQWEPVNQVRSGRKQP